MLREYSKQIRYVLLTEPPETNLLCDCYVNGKFDEEYKLLYSDYLTSVKKLHLSNIVLNWIVSG